jgi:membrane fusion protein, heavy metal efflux system
MTRWTIALLAAPAAVAALAVAGAVGGGPARASTPGGEATVATPAAFLRTAPVALTREGGAATATARVAFDEERVSRVGSPVSGRVLELLARPGDRVKKGQALLLIASQDVETASADVVAAEADLRVAEKALERARRLDADQAIPHKDVLAAESDAVKARAAVARARSRLDVLGVTDGERSPRARFTLRAPIEGIVVERPATVGMEVRADTGAPLVTVADLSRVWVLADVYERDLGLVAKGQQAEVRVPAYPGETFRGAVTNVGDLVDPATRTVKIRVEVPNPALRLKPEMFARVLLAGGRGEPALTVPVDALLSDGDTVSVIVALGKDRFQKRSIEVGPEQEGRVRVLAGLRPGEEVVVDGALFVKAELDAR